MDDRDAFGNVCTRLVAPPGLLEIRNDFIIRDSGQPDAVVPNAQQWNVSALPDEAVMYLLGSRYCDTDRLSERLGRYSAVAAAGGAFKRSATTSTSTLSSATRRPLRPHRLRRHAERPASAATLPTSPSTLCRCMNIPARYCTGYLGDIGVPRDPAPMDFSAWFEAFLDGRWFTFDARHNHPRIGRIVMARGRDAADVAISTAFGLAALARFGVITEEVVHEASRSLTLETTAS